MVAITIFGKYSNIWEEGADRGNPVGLEAMAYVLVICVPWRIALTHTQIRRRDLRHDPH